MDIKVKRSVKGKSCNTNPVIKWIRILISLSIIVLGIYYKNWFGILGLFTLYTAITGQCSLNMEVNSSKYDKDNKY